MHSTLPVLKEEIGRVIYYKNIKLRFNEYIHRAAGILRIGKKRVELPWIMAIRHFAFTISLTIERQSAIRKCTEKDASVYMQ
jgi:hypothetical protein